MISTRDDEVAEMNYTLSVKNTREEYCFLYIRLMGIGERCLVLTVDLGWCNREQKMSWRDFRLSFGEWLD